MPPIPAKVDGSNMRVCPENAAAGKAQRPTGRCVMTRFPCRSYFFLAALTLPDPHEDLLLFAGFFDMHAIAVPPLRSDEWVTADPCVSWPPLSPLASLPPSWRPWPGPRLP